MQCVLPMFSEEGWEYHGEYFDFPLRNVMPKPRQKPHPPLWVACSQLETIEMAGRRGMGALGFQFVSAEAAHGLGERLLQRLHEAARQAVRLPDEPEHRRRVSSSCAPTPTRRRSAAPTAATFFQFALRFYNTHGPVDPGTVNLWDEYQRLEGDAEGQQAATDGGLIGSPATIRRNGCAQFEESNVDQVILLNQAGKNTPRGHLRDPRAVRRPR